jgi:hypothetical protein
MSSSGSSLSVAKGFFLVASEVLILRDFFPVFCDGRGGKSLLLMTTILEWQPRGLAESNAEGESKIRAAVTKVLCSENLQLTLLLVSR